MDKLPPVSVANRESLFPAAPRLRASGDRGVSLDSLLIEPIAAGVGQAVTGSFGLKTHVSGVVQLSQVDKQDEEITCSDKTLSTEDSPVLVVEIDEEGDQKLSGNPSDNDESMSVISQHEVDQIVDETEWEPLDWTATTAEPYTAPRPMSTALLNTAERMVDSTLNFAKESVAVFDARIIHPATYGAAAISQRIQSPRGQATIKRVRDNTSQLVGGAARLGVRVGVSAVKGVRMGADVACSLHRKAAPSNTPPSTAVNRVTIHDNRSYDTHQ